MVQRVLVVDDDPLIRKVSQRALERKAFDVAVAGSIAEATDLIAARSFDVAILDYFLDGGEYGCDLIAPLRAHNPSIRIAVVTSLNRSAELVGDAYASGADLVASKVNVDWGAVARLDRRALPTRAKAEVDLWTLRRDLMHGAFLEHGGNISQAARALGMNRTSLYRALQMTPPPDLDEK